MDQTVSRGWFYLRAPSCTQQQVTGRANPNPNPNPDSLYAKAQTCVAQTRSSQFSWSAFQLFSGHLTCPSSSVTGCLTLGRILPVPCSCQRKHSSTTALSLRELRMLPSNTVEDRREEPRPGGPCGHLAPPWLLSHPTHHAGLELLLRPHLSCLFFLPSFLLFLSSPLNHLPSIDNSANC